MKTRRIVFAGVAVAGLLLFTARLPASKIMLSQFMACTAELPMLPCAWVILRAESPSAIAWGSHAEFAKCAGAIADPAQWPVDPAMACEVMHMCVNEAPLSDAEQESLLATIRKTPNCQDP
jgi:hypothetical protein